MTGLKFTLRTLAKNPAFALSAILAAGLGIGAATAIYSVIDGILLRPMPFPRPDRIVNVWETELKRNIPRMVAAPANYLDWRVSNEVFSATGAYRPATFNLSTPDGEPERFVGAACDPGFFAVLEVAPILGRVFTAEEDQPGRNNVVLLSYSVWQQRFGADPDVIGRDLTLDGRRQTVIGVMPKDFEYPALATMWAPLALDGATRQRRDLHTLRVMGRLKDGVTLARARADFQALGARLAQAYPDLNQDESIAVNPMLDDVVGDIRPALLVLLGAVVFLLLIACANVANLLLAKASGRQREIAIRASLGAGRAAILRQMLAESLLLALLGGAFGLGLAAAAFRWLVAVAPASVPRLTQVGVNWSVAAVAFALSLATGILFGLAPAWHAARVDVHALLKEGMRGTSGRNPLRSVLVVGQVAVTLMLLAGAGLVIRSFYEVAHVDAGFNPEHLMTMRISPAPYQYRGKADLQIQLVSNLLRVVSALPGVRTAGITTDLPLAGNPLFIMRFEGRPPVTPSQAPVANYFAVTAGFFDAMGMRIVKGRAIDDRDTREAPQVAVVNQALADRYFPGENPLGKRLEVAFATPPNWREIVGVVADVKSAGLDQDSPVQVYTALVQNPTFVYGMPLGLTILARTAQDPGSMSAAMKSAILGVDRSQPVYAVQAMSEIVSRSIAQRRLSLILLAFFAASALVLASVGVYGVMSYSVAQRTSEIGVRMALGARQWQVLFLVERQGMALVAAGLVIGIAGAVVSTRFMDALLFHVGARDPLTFLIAAATLAAVSLFACYLPARRASRVDPVEALR